MSEPVHCRKIVYFIRHGQSAGNTSAIFQHYESPLNEKGHSQARRVADRVASLDFELLISSPQRRAYETAAVIAQKASMPIILSELFVSRGKPSSIDGKPLSDPQVYAIGQAWEQSLHTRGQKIQDGENCDEILARTDKALSYLLKADAQKIVVVSHGYFIRTIVARALFGERITGDVLERFHKLTAMENSGITVMHYKSTPEAGDDWHLWSLNDHAHVA